jgi:hypothetical protein
MRHLLGGRVRGGPRGQRDVVLHGARVSRPVYQRVAGAEQHVLALHPVSEGELACADAAMGHHESHSNRCPRPS